MSDTSSKTVGDVFREHQDDVVIAIALLHILVDARETCGCVGCLAIQSGHVLAVGDLAKHLISNTGLSTSQVHDLVAGARRRLEKGVPA